MLQPPVEEIRNTATHLMITEAKLAEHLHAVRSHVDILLHDLLGTQLEQLRTMLAQTQIAEQTLSNNLRDMASLLNALADQLEY